MRAKTLRLLTILSTLLVTLITAIQLYWLNTTYNYERKQFNIAITRVIKSTLINFNLLNNQDFSFEKNIQLPAPDYYIVPVSHLPNFDSVKNFVTREFFEFNILTDCELLFYNAGHNKYETGFYIDVSDQYKFSAKNNFPGFNRAYHYLGFYFPHREHYILQHMLKWIISSFLLLMVLIGFGISVFYFYRQQFLNETQKDFVNNFSHEFKTPLAVMKIAAEVLSRPSITEQPQKLHNYTEIINTQVTHLQKQLNRMLMVAYTDNHKLKPEKEKFNANELLEITIHNMLPLAEQKNGKIIFENRTADAFIHADKSYILTAIANLLENAVKYSVKPEISVSTYIEGNEFCIRVADKGLGIEKVHHKKIFKKFYRVTEGDIHPSKGFGLGLNFVKKIIDAHRGKILLKSRKGFGSTFIIKLPVT